MSEGSDQLPCEYPSRDRLGYLELNIRLSHTLRGLAGNNIACPKYVRER